MGIEGKSTEEIEALATLAESIGSNPKTRMQFQRLLKQANPNISVPEVEIEDRIQAAVKPHVDELERLKARDAQSDAQAAANALYENLRDDGLVKNRTGFGDLVKYANEHGFQTTDGGLRMAAQHRRAEQESAEPTPQTAAGAFDINDRATNKDLMANPAAWARNTALSALDELAKKRKAAA